MHGKANHSSESNEKAVEIRENGQGYMYIGGGPETARLLIREKSAIAAHLVHCPTHIMHSPSA